MDTTIKFILNNEIITTDANPGSVLLDFIRKNKNLTGTKEGCREGDCGACAVISGELTENGIRYKTINSCLCPLGNVANKHIITIEGINSSSLSPIQKYFVEEGASQCGFCTPGFIISLTEYLISNEKLAYSDALNAISGNICRCTGYSSIKRVVKRLIDNIILVTDSSGSHLNSLIELKIIPEYFLQIESRLAELNNSNSTLDKQADSEKVIMGGGTDLYVQSADKMLNQSLQFVTGRNQPEISIKNNICTLSGNVTFEKFKESLLLQKYFPDISNQLNLVASKPIRNSATIAGNIVNASPIGDLTIFLLALNSKINLSNNGNTRDVFLKDFYKGYKSLDKKKDEIIESISFEIPGDNSHFNFEKVSKRTYLDIASVNTSIHLKVNDNKITEAMISAGGVGPIPLYLKKSSEFLIDKEINSKNIFELLSVILTDISPISDVRGTAEYKSLLLQQLIKAHFIKLFPDKITFEALL